MALLAWIDHAKNGTVTATNTELKDASNMLLPGGFARARLDDAITAQFIIDLGSAQRLDALCLMGINARREWDVGVSLGLSAAGDMGAPSAMIGDEYTSARDVPFGASAIIDLGATYTARFITINADWDIGSDGYYDIPRFLALEGVRLDGVSIQSSRSAEGSGEAIISPARFAAIEEGYHWRAWNIVLNNLTLAKLSGDENDPGAAACINDLAAEWSNNPEVLLIPRTDSVHQLVQSSIVGILTGPIQTPGRPRGATRTQFAQFQMAELLYKL